MEMVEEGRIPPKRIKFQEIVEDGKEDRFSALPDCLLIEILSRLPSTKDAITTGTLSKRCKHLWTLVPTLIFHDYDYNQMCSDYIDKTLTQCRQRKLKRFEVCTSYDPVYESQVSSWIRYAVRRNVEELNLRLFVESEDEFPLYPYFFISSCFTDMTLQGCILNPTVVISWKNLRSLCISNGKLDEDLIENILYGSPLLETLELDACSGYKRLDIASKSVKKLVLSGYRDLEDDSYFDDSIEISAPNILSLTILGQLLWKLLLVNVYSLVEFILHYERLGPWETMLREAEEEMLKGFLLNLHDVKELKIGSSCSKVVSRLEAKGFVCPSNIKHPDVSSYWPDSDSD